MTLIKICGLTTEIEADYINENKVDFAGIVLFFKKSKRNVTQEQAKAILHRLDKKVKSVAVTVSPDREQVYQIQQMGFDYIQIHGKLEEEVIRISSIPILRAITASELEEYDRAEKCEKIKGIVFDSLTPGSGTVFDWSILQQIERKEKLFLLAGGLNPDNVREAIKKIHPDGVDVSSGVENDNGIGKSRTKIGQFVSNVRSLDKS